MIMADRFLVAILVVMNIGLVVLHLTRDKTAIEEQKQFVEFMMTGPQGRVIVEFNEGSGRGTAKAEFPPELASLVKDPGTVVEVMRQRIASNVSPMVGYRVEIRLDPDQLPSFWRDDATKKIKVAVHFKITGG